MAKPWPRWSSTGCVAPCSVCAIKAPGYGDRRKAMMEDIAILTGGYGHLRSVGRQAGLRHPG